MSPAYVCIHQGKWCNCIHVSNCIGFGVFTLDLWVKVYNSIFYKESLFLIKHFVYTGAIMISNQRKWNLVIFYTKLLVFEMRTENKFKSSLLWGFLESKYCLLFL